MRPGFLLLLLILTLAPAVLRGQSWIMKVPGSGLGNPLAVNPLDSNVLYGAAGGDKVFVSRDRGYTWSVHGTPVPGGGVVKSVCVDPADTLRMLAGVESSVGVPDRVAKTTDGGATWNETWHGSFSYYGQPLEFSSAHPDTVYTMGLDTLFRSTDFGSTWDTVCSGRGFNAWCDAALRPDSAAVMYLGDNLSGIWKTADHGANWRKVYSTLGEIPSIAIDPLSPNVAYAGRFGGGGGLVKSTDWGETWHPLTVPTGSRDAWWVTCSPVHPGYVYYGTYIGDTAYLGIYLSRNSGASWTRLSAGLTQGGYFNYGILALDSLTVVALQSNGIYKYQYPAVVELESPDGGEVWLADSVREIRWSASGIYAVRIDYSTDGGGTWSVIADSVPAGDGSYAWTVPEVLSAECRVRVSDALFTTASDQSDGSFVIAEAELTLLAPNGGESWDAGSVHDLMWACAVADTLEIEFSDDGGVSWSAVTRALSGAGSVPWTVLHQPTAAGLIRVRRATDSSVVDASDALFEIAAVPEFTALLAFADAGGGRDTLLLANAAGATDGIDSTFGEAELPPPVAGDFDVRWTIAGTGGSAADVRDTLPPAPAERIFRASIQPGPAGYPVNLAWIPEAFRSGTFILRDAATGGELVNSAMRREGAAVVPGAAAGGLEIVQCAAAPVVIPGNGVWNLVSLPVETGDRRAASLFPGAWSGIFAYRAGYVKRDTLRHGQGYWVRTERTTITGCPVAVETLRVSPGWNLIGAPGASATVASLGTVPESLVASPFYAYEEGGYEFADSLLPSRGYWVKCRDTGMILAPPLAQAAGAARVDPLFATRPAVVLSVGAGDRVLRFYSGEARRPLSLESPPPPPGESPSASVKNGEIGVFHPSSLDSPVDLEIPLSGGETKLNFSWHVEIQEKFDYILVEKAGAQEISVTALRGDGSTSLPSTPESGFFLRVQPRGPDGGGMPRAFSVGEWYPNPFNPTTHVTFAVPSESRVSYTVYNLLGEVVATSEISVCPAGEHALEWSAVRDDGTPLGSGVYFIEVIAVPRGDSPANRPARSVGKVLLVR